MTHTMTTGVTMLEDQAKCPGTKCGAWGSPFFEFRGGSVPSKMGPMFGCPNPNCRVVYVRPFVMFRRVERARVG